MAHTMVSRRPSVSKGEIYKCFENGESASVSKVEIYKCFKMESGSVSQLEICKCFLKLRVSN